MKHPWPAVLRICLGAVFVFSGSLKLLQPSQEFLSVVLGFEIVGGPSARFLSVFLPWAECLGGVFLVLGLWTEAALWCLWALNSLFILALGSVLARRIPMKDCGCFGERFSLPVWATLLLDFVFWAAFWVLWRSKHRSFTLDSAFQK